MASSPSQLPPQIGPYEIRCELGSGGMGTVYEGVDSRDGTVAAVKVLPAAMAREPGLVERFRREVASLQKLTSPHIVRCLESGEHEDLCYYAMELVDGETLTERLGREYRLEWRAVVDIGVQVCRALKAAHDAGIIHRDLKPGNLMFTADDQVKLTDFGVAQVFAAGKLTATGGIVGTAEYMSPEQAQGRKAHRTSDLYSLGAVMYCMLTGRPPFSGRSTVDIIQQHRYGQCDPPRSIVPEIPRWLDEVVCRLLNKDPDDRYPDAFVLGRRLEEIPKKVALSEGEMTEPAGIADEREFQAIDRTEATEIYRLARSDESSSEVDDRTVPATSVTVDAGPRRRSGPGEATMARDLMEFEIRRQAQRSRMGRWLNSTPGLLIAMVVVVGITVVMFNRGRMTPEQRFDEGLRLMNQSDPDWRTARDRYFLPLLEEDAEGWENRLKPVLERVARLESQARSRPRPRLIGRAPETESEPARFLRLARESERAGDRPRAIRILKSLVVLIDGQEDYAAEAEVARALLSGWTPDRDSGDGPVGLVAAALQRAEVAREEGRIEEARRVWQSIVELYTGDPRVKDEVDQARRQLAEPGGEGS